MLARDRVKRISMPPAIFYSGYFVAYALASAKDIELDEPRKVAEAQRSKH